jgi:hypothetical protein
MQNSQLKNLNYELCIMNLCTSTVHYNYISTNTNEWFLLVRL